MNDICRRKEKTSNFAQSTALTFVRYIYPLLPCFSFSKHVFIGQLTFSRPLSPHLQNVDNSNIPISRPYKEH